MGWRDSQLVGAGEAANQEEKKIEQEKWRDSSLVGPKPAKWEESPISYQDEYTRIADTNYKLKFARRRLRQSPLPDLFSAMTQVTFKGLSKVQRVTGLGDADESNRIANAFEQASREMDRQKPIPEWLSRGVRGTAVSLPEVAAAGAVAGPYGAIGAAMLGETNEAITEGRDAGLRGIDLAEYAASQGVVEGAPAFVMQKIGLGGLESMFGKQASRVVSRGVLDGLKKFGIQTLSELGEENITELGHSIASVVAGVSEGDLKPENILGTVRDTTVQTLMTMGVVAGSQAALNRTERARAASYAKAKEEILRMADAGDTPSRQEWIHKLKMPVSEGRTAGQRRGRLQFAAAEIRRRDAAIEALRAAATEEPAVAGQPSAVEPGAAGSTKAAEPAVVTSEPQAALKAVAPGLAAQSFATGQQQAVEPVSPDIQESRAGARMAPSKHDMEIETEGTGEAIGGREVARQLERIWEAPVRRGRIGFGRRSGVRGIYKLRDYIVRLAKGEESSPAVLSHELAHHLDNILKPRYKWSQQAIKELGMLDYDQNAQRPSEGFAEFVRGWVTGSTQHIQGIDLPSVVPHTFAEFSRFLTENPKVRGQLQESTNLVSRWRKAGAVGRVKGQISETGVDTSAGRRTIKEFVRDVTETAYTKLKDEAYPIIQFERAAKKQGAMLKPGQSPYEILSAFRSSATNRAAESIEHGVYSVDFQKKLGQSMTEVLDGIEQGEDYENFITWAYARHAVESWGVEKNPAVTLEDAKETVKQLYDKRYEQAADRLTQWNNSLIDMLAYAGCLSKEEAQVIKDYYKTYIPLHRATPNAKGRKVNLSHGLKGRRGSGLQIIDPVEASLARAAKFFEDAQKQKVVESVADIAKTTKGLGEWFEIVPPEMVATHFGVDDVRKQLTKEFEKGKSGYKPGQDEVDLLESMLDQIDPTAVMAIWRPEMFKFHGEPIFRLLVDGKPTLVQLKPELAGSLDVLNASRDLWRGEALAKVFVGATKFGATRANPDFIIANGIRDWQTFIMQGSKGLKGVIDPVQWSTAYALNELQITQGKPGNPVIELWKRTGGELSTYVGLDRDKLKRGINRALRRRPSRRETSANILGITEVGPRIAEFATVFKKNGWLDRLKAGETPPLDLIVQATNAASDVTVNFKRMGSWGRHLNNYIPFLNAKAEGIAQFSRTWKKKPIETLYRTAQCYVLGELIYWWYRHDDDDYKERSWWQDLFWIFTDNDGNPKWRIPRSQEWGLIGSGIERMMDLAFDKDPEAIERWGHQAFKTLLPDVNPAGITPMLETAANYSMFRERPIVSERLSKFQNRDQFYEHTSALAKSAADALFELSGGKVDLSPAKMDYLTDNLTGGLYRRITSPVEKLASGESWSLSDVPGLKGITLRKDYSKSLDDFYDYASDLDKAHNSRKLREQKDKDLDEWRKTKYAVELLTDMRKSARKLSDDQRQKVERSMTGLARSVLGRSPLSRYPNPLSDMSDLPLEVRKAIETHIGRKSSTATQTATTPKSIYEANAAVRYLVDIGVNGPAASTALYNHLRQQGMRADRASERAVQIERMLPGKSK